MGRILKHEDIEPSLTSYVGTHSQVEVALTEKLCEVCIKNNSAAFKHYLNMKMIHAIYLLKIFRCAGLKVKKS